MFRTNFQPWPPYELTDLFYFSPPIPCKLRSREGGPNKWNLLRAGTVVVEIAALSIKQEALHEVQNCILAGYLMLCIVLVKQ